MKTMQVFRSSAFCHLRIILKIRRISFKLIFKPEINTPMILFQTDHNYRKHRCQGTLG